MATKQIVIIGDSAGVLNADTAATPNTVPLRDNAGSETMQAQIGAELQSTGILTLKRSVVKTASFTADTSAFNFPCDATAGAIVATIPLANTCAGRAYVFKRVDSSGNNTTLTVSGADTIDGAATKVLTAQYKYISIMSNGTNGWDIIANN